MNEPTPRTDSVIDACVAASESTETLCRKLGNLCTDLERERNTLAAAMRELSELPLPGAAEEIIEAALATLRP